MDALCRIRIPGEERQVLDCIFRKTYGWNKCEDAISLSQFVEMTGLTKPHIIHSIAGLLLKKVIIVAENGNTPAKVYKFNKNYDQWNPLPKKAMLPKMAKSVAENGNASLPKTVPTKDTNTKDNKERASLPKKATPFVLPEYIPQETWQAYMAVRIKKKAAQTPYAFNLIVKALEKIKKDYGHDPVDVLNKSITGGWTDVYPLKNGETVVKPKW
jgi:phage replication O-like protein O